MKKLEIKPAQTVGKYSGILTVDIENSNLTFEEIDKNGEVKEDTLALQEIKDLFSGKDVKITITGVDPE